MKMMQGGTSADRRKYDVRWNLMGWGGEGGGEETRSLGDSDSVYETNTHTDIGEACCARKCRQRKRESESKENIDETIMPILFGKKEETRKEIY